jgi:1-acyl-sn-glycerol-3-phosphate acyltransferase
VANEGKEYRRRENDVAIRLLQAITIPYARLFHRIDVRGQCQLPARGPAILVCNHTSSLDPVLIQAVCPRLIRWMMAREYIEVKPLRSIFNTMGVILVERKGRDAPAFRAAMRALDDGYILGIFPEGKIELTPELLPFHQGIGLFALRSGAPVHPCYLTGTQRGTEMVQAFIRPRKAKLAFGPPLDLSDVQPTRKGVLLATERIRSAVQELKNASDGK